MTTMRYKAGAVPTVTPQELDDVQSIKDADIDCSDIPELDEDFWNNAKRGGLYRPRKQQVTVKIDADVLLWLKSGGKGYQTRLNAILRRAMFEKIES